ncbi:MAG TPA: DUF2510 domain-containing protein [Pseudolysinimonas sp.]|nr:DUF2510 domain-containing protein [Pseudolysinimonas sp.]
MTAVETLPAPGWYSDPHVPAQQRWWSGAAWTEHVQAIQAAPPTVTAPVVVPNPPAAPAPAATPTARPLAAATALSTPLPPAISTEEQLAWHREDAPEVTRAGFGTGTGAIRTSQPSSISPHSAPTNGSGHAASVNGMPGYAAPGYGPAAYGTPARYGEMMAPPPENRVARRALVWALVSIVINPLLIFSIIAIATGAKGRGEARVIEAMGFGPAESRRGTAGAAIGIGVGVIAIQLLAAALWFVVLQPHYDQAKVESAISTELSSRLTRVNPNATVDVNCPPTASLTVGTTFDCGILVSDGSAGVAHVKVTDAAGSMSWTVTAATTGA